ncbi:MAG: spore cortex biosynthesis protein YabQ [Lachnospiraceae bacterium]|nr:spore cortex biosynthesis protein YabQ [Lachnospiraceae bacterium]
MIDIQFNMFCMSILYGAGMGISYDVIRIFRRIVKTNGFFVGLEDLLFWIVWAFVTIDGIHIYNSGELRIYVFLGILIGFLIYRYTIGWVARKIMHYILCARKKHPQKDK